VRHVLSHYMAEPYQEKRSFGRNGHVGKCSRLVEENWSVQRLLVSAVGTGFNS
jgi:hypothetical protein